MCHMKSNPSVHCSLGKTRKFALILLLPIRKPIKRVLLGTSSLLESQFATEVPVIRPAWSQGSPASLPWPGDAAPLADGETPGLTQAVASATWGEMGSGVSGYGERLRDYKHEIKALRFNQPWASGSGWLYTIKSEADIQKNVQCCNNIYYFYYLILLYRIVKRGVSYLNKWLL